MITFFLQQSPTTSRYYYTPAKWMDTTVRLTDGKKGKTQAVINGSSKRLPDNTPSAILAPADADASLLPERASWDGQNLVEYVAQ
jgi:hypothetical protein